MTTPKAGHEPIDLSLYGGQDPRDLPRYTFDQASRATDVPVSTIASWVRGVWYTKKGRKSRMEPVISRPDPDDKRLSFNNLIETHVLRALREAHEVRLETVRRAIGVAEKTHGIERLLISPQLKTSGGALFLDSYFELEHLALSAQFAMRSIMKEYLERVHIDEHWLKAEFCPIPRTPAYRDLQLISVSPFVAFGRPLIRSVGVSTRAVAERIDVGETKQAVMEDYGLTEEDFTEAMLYEARPHQAAA